MRALRVVSLAAMILILTGCRGLGPVGRQEPSPPRATPVEQWLSELPSAETPIFAAVYGLPDQTGQLRTSGESVQNYSRAVSQGGEALLLRGLRKVAGGSFFRVLDRGSLERVITERRIIREAKTSAGETADVLPPLFLAGVVIDGAIVGYDSNISTSGLGARFQNIGGFVEQRRDVVTVALKATSTRTGEVLHAVLAEKTVWSVSSQGSVFRFLDNSDNLLELEGGATANEPGLVALQQAVDLGIYLLAVEGASLGLWKFRDEAATAAVIADYQARLGRAPPQARDPAAQTPLPLSLRPVDETGLRIASAIQWPRARP